VEDKGYVYTSPDNIPFKDNTIEPKDLELSTDFE